METQRANKNPHYIFVICTYNSLHYLKETIRSIYDQVEKPFIFITDDGSIDGTREWLKENSSLFKILRISRKNVGIVKGRNVATSFLLEYLEKYPYSEEYPYPDGIIFLDADAGLKKNWDKEIRQYIGDPTVGLVGKWGSNIKSRDPLLFQTPEYKNGRASNVDVIQTCFAYINTATFIEAGATIEKLPFPFWHEGLEYSLRMKSIGKTNIIDQNINVYHKQHGSLGGGFTDADILRKYPGFEQNAKFIFEMEKYKYEPTRN